MYMRVNIIKHASKVEADALRALAKYEMINELEGVISIEVIRMNDTNSIAILKFQNKAAAEKSRAVYIDQFKKQSNMKVDSYEGPRDFIVEK